MTSHPAQNTPLTDSEITAHYQAGTLLAELQCPLDTNHQEALHGQLAALNNAGIIDMLALVATPEFRNIARRNFFNIQQIYHGVIPRLEAPPLAMLETVRSLITQGNNDGVSTILNNALCRWIGQAPTRAQAIISSAQSDPDIDKEVLRTALVSLEDLNFVNLFLSAADARRQSAIAALGTIKLLNQQEEDEALEKLVEIATVDTDQDMRFTAIFSVFSLLHRCKAQAPKWVPRIVASVATAPTDVARTALLNGLWLQTDLFQLADAKAVLETASNGDLSSERLIGLLGATLSRLIGGIHHELAIDCLTGLLSSDGKALPLGQLQALEHRLTSLDRGRLFALCVRWFSTGDPKLCEAISNSIGGVEQAQPFDASLVGFGLTGNQMVVLCHKVIGYLFLAPIVATSFVVAALRANDETAEPELIQLLLQALLVNYGDTVAVYLKGLPKTDVAYRAAHKALKLYRTYRNGLDIKIPVKELHPSSYERGIVRQKHYIMEREIRKQAHRQSVFFKLTHRSNLLYGRKAITYAAGPDKPPVTMEMKTISANLEMPKLQVIDPVGFEWLIRIFRVSKPK